MSKDQIQTTEDARHDETDLKNAPGVVLKSSHDKLGLWASVKKFKKASNVIANQGFISHVGFPNEDGEYMLNANYTALWGALQSLGQLIGMLSLNVVSDKIGRKMTLYVLWVILAASLILETLVRDWRDWAGAKLLAGIGVGGIQSTLPVYVTEWAPANIRGAMVLLYGFWNSWGKFLPPMVLTLVQDVDPLNFKVPIYTQWGFLGLMLPIFIWLPETAAYYASRDLDDKGKATLRRVNGKIEGYDVEVEYAIIKNTILEERASQSENQAQGFKQVVQSFLDCLKGVDAKRTLGSTLPICAQQLTGLAFLNTYASLFFRQAGFRNAFLITTILATISLVVSVTLILATDRFGRRPVVLVGTATDTIALLIVAILGFVPKTTPLQNFLIFVGCVWSFFNSALGQLGWAFVGEVASQRLRARTAGLASAFSVIFGLIFNTTVPYMLDPQTANWNYKTGFLFFGTGLVVAVLIYLYTPEPAQRNPAELDEMYQKGVPAWKMRKALRRPAEETDLARPSPSPSPALLPSVLPVIELFLDAAPGPVMATASPAKERTGTRRQAVNVCSACRERKIRCDEAKPSCSRCKRLGLSCSYMETISSRKALYAQDLTDTLKRMESKLDMLVNNHSLDAQDTSPGSTGANSSNTQTLPSLSVKLSPMVDWSYPSEGSFQPMQELAIPKRHLTAPQHLLAWQSSPIRLSDLERRYPVELEIRKPREPWVDTSASIRTWLANLSMSRLRAFTGLYFSHFHPHYLILDEDFFYSQHLQRALRSGFKDGIESCLVLMVLSLGVMVSRHVDSHELPQEDVSHENPDCELGLLNLAIDIFRYVDETDWTSIQCLLLMGRYYNARLRVYDYWRAVNKACVMIMILLPLQETLEPHHCQLYWIAYLQESQILAELDFPPSGLSGLESVVRLPLAPCPSTDPNHKDYQSFFLALISMRRLLNRIHSYIYDRDTPVEPSPAVVAELDRQLEEWKACLPEVHQFPDLPLAQQLETTQLYRIRPLHERLKGHLQTRYYSARAILYRSCVRRVLNPLGNAALSANDLQGARVSLSSALLSVLNGGILHEPYEFLLHPINSWRTLFAAELQIAFTLRDERLARHVLPEGWELIQWIREKAVTPTVTGLSPALARDYELLQLIMAAQRKDDLQDVVAF
ncbi:sugar transporter [Paramyrothecium foliicola]|nr:sugar transporter [Paramyrothecium foliicola]